MRLVTVLPHPQNSSRLDATMNRDLKGQVTLSYTYEGLRFDSSGAAYRCICVFARGIVLLDPKKQYCEVRSHTTSDQCIPARNAHIMHPYYDHKPMHTHAHCHTFIHMPKACTTQSSQLLRYNAQSHDKCLRGRSLAKHARMASKESIGASVLCAA